MVLDYFDKHVVLAKINAEVDTALKDAYHISGYPTLVLTDASGGEIDRLVGYFDPPDFVQKIDDYRNGIGTLEDLLRRADTLADRDLYFEIADKYKYRGGSEEARAWYQRVIEGGEPTDSLSAKSRMSLADMVRRSKQYDSAAAEYAAIMVDFAGTEYAEWAEIWRAIAYRQKGDTAMAIKAFEDFLVHYPESEDTSYARSQIDKLTGKTPPED